jgi:predicted ATPase/DNA-binding CsgD family transcriptional regulator
MARTRAAVVVQLEQPLRESAHNLPAELTSFVGRREVIRRLKLAAGQSRLVTLVGMGGVGKTRLVVRVAAQLLAEFPDGAWFVDLAAVPKGGAVADAVAAGVRVPVLQASAEEALVAYLRRRRALVVLDNCEHVIDAAADVAHRLLAGCPNVRILATSREPLRISGEALFKVDPLASVDESLALLEARGRTHDPDFRLTHATRPEAQRLCLALAGVPLAIELAAARLRHLTLAELADGLGAGPHLLSGGARDASRRHRSLEAALDWSYELLGADEQRALLQLSVFVGGFDLEAAEHVLSGVVSSPALEVLAALVDRSLLERFEGVRERSRYVLLEPVRRYGEGRLRAVSDSSAHQAHARHFARLAERAWKSVLERESIFWSDRVEEEHGNLEAAAAFLESSEPPGALALVSHLWLYWFFRGRYAAGAARLDAALAVAGDVAAPEHRARALCGLAWLRHMTEGALGSERALAEAEEALEIARAIQDSNLAAWALITAGAISMPVSVDDACDRFNEAVRISSGEGLDRIRTFALSYLAGAEFLAGRRDRGVSLASDALPAARAASPYLLSMAASVLARDAVFEGRPEAERLWEESLAAARASSNDEYSRFALNWLADLAARRGELAAAAGSWLEAARIAQRLGNRQALIQAVEFAGVVLVSAGDHEAAVTLLAAAAAFKQERWAESPFWTARIAATTGMARRSLNEQRANTAAAAGAVLSVEEALELATAEMRRVEQAAASRSPQPGGLSRRELEVARLVAVGLTNKEVASRLFISERTAEAHVQHILAKTGLANRTQVAAWIADLPAT